MYTSINFRVEWDLIGQTSDLVLYYPGPYSNSFSTSGFSRLLNREKGIPLISLSLLFSSSPSLPD